MIANRLIIFVSILLLVLVVIIILTDFLVFLALLVVFFTQFCIILGLFIGFIIIFLFSTLILYVLRLRFEFFLLLRLLLTAFSVCSIQSQILAFGSCCRWLLLGASFSCCSFLRLRFANLRLFGLLTRLFLSSLVSEQRTLRIHCCQNRDSCHLTRLVHEEAGVADHVAAEVLGRVANRPSILLLPHLPVHAKNAHISIKEAHLGREHQVELEGLDDLLLQVDKLLLPVWFLLLESDDIDNQVKRRAGCLIELSGYEDCDRAQTN